MAAWAWILIVIAAVVVVALVVVATRQRRTMALRQRFGPEYDHAVEAREGRRLAEADLRAREHRRPPGGAIALPLAVRRTAGSG
jgi:hypothetical protein